MGDTEILGICLSGRNKKISMIDNDKFGTILSGDLFHLLLYEVIDDIFRDIP